MADTNGNAGEGADTKGKASDAIFMMECLKHLQTPATVDVSAVAKALGYGNPMSVANRIREIRKRFDLRQHLSCSVNSANAGSATPRKGAKASTGPIKAKMEPSEEMGEDVKTEKAKPGKKPAAKRGRKPKAVAAEDDTPAEPTANGDNVETNEEAGAAAPDDTV